MMWGLVVNEKYRNQEIGSKLFLKLEENAIRDKRAWLILCATTKTKKTVNFYKKHGYDIGNSYMECAKDLNIRKDD